MTAEASGTGSGEQIAMTAPVTSSATDAGTFVVRFSMPRMSSLATLPEPANDRVRIVQTDEQLALARRFRARFDDPVRRRPRRWGR